jgi:hypothetical protein
VLQVYYVRVCNVEVLNQGKGVQREIEAEGSSGQNPSLFGLKLDLLQRTQISRAIRGFSTSD